MRRRSQYRDDPGKYTSPRSTSDPIRGISHDRYLYCKTRRAPSGEASNNNASGRRARWTYDSLALGQLSYLILSPVLNCDEDVSTVAIKSRGEVTHSSIIITLMMRTFDCKFSRFAEAPRRNYHRTDVCTRSDGRRPGTIYRRDKVHPYRRTQ